MSKEIEAPKQLSEIVRSKEFYYGRNVFLGHGQAMPAFLNDDESVSLVFLLHEEKQAVGKMQTAEETYELSKVAVPISMLTFTKDDNGVKAIDSVRKWLDKVEELLTAENKG